MPYTHCLVRLVGTTLTTLRSDRTVDGPGNRFPRLDPGLRPDGRRAGQLLSHHRPAAVHRQRTGHALGYRRDRGSGLRPARRDAHRAGPVAVRPAELPRTAVHGPALRPD